MNKKPRAIDPLRLESYVRSYSRQQTRGLYAFHEVDRCRLCCDAIALLDHLPADGVAMGTGAWGGYFIFRVGPGYLPP